MSFLKDDVRDITTWDFTLFDYSIKFPRATSSSSAYYFHNNTCADIQL